MNAPFDEATLLAMHGCFVSEPSQSDAIKLSISVLLLIGLTLALAVAGYIKAGMNLSAVLDHLS